MFWGFFGGWGRKRKGEEKVGEEGEEKELY